jgi:hypothetical protein
MLIRFVKPHVYLLGSILSTPSRVIDYQVMMSFLLQEPNADAEAKPIRIANCRSSAGRSPQCFHFGTFHPLPLEMHSYQSRAVPLYSVRIQLGHLFKALQDGALSRVGELQVASLAPVIHGLFGG